MSDTSRYSVLLLDQAGGICRTGLWCRPLSACSDSRPNLVFTALLRLLADANMPSYLLGTLTDEVNPPACPQWQHNPP